MTAFFLALIPLAALELTCWPRAALLTLFLGQRDRPVAGGIAFVAGTFAAYVGLGLLIVFGLGSVLERVSDAVIDRIGNPEGIDYLVTFLLGLGLLVFSIRTFLKKPSTEAAEAEAPPEEKGGSLFKAFGTGVGSNLIVGPNTIGSFAAFTQIMKAEFNPAATLVMVLLYSLLVVLPLVLLVWVSAVNRERAEKAFEAMRAFFGRSGKRLLPTLGLITALLLLADSIGFFLGHPLFPTGS